MWDCCWLRTFQLYGVPAPGWVSGNQKVSCDHFTAVLITVVHFLCSSSTGFLSEYFWIPLQSMSNKWPASKASILDQLGNRSIYVHPSHSVLMRCVHYMMNIQCSGWLTQYRRGRSDCGESFSLIVHILMQLFPSDITLNWLSSMFIGYLSTVKNYAFENYSCKTTYRSLWRH